MTLIFVANESTPRHDWRRTLARYQERNTMIAASLDRWEEPGIPPYNPLSALRNATKPYQISTLNEDVIYKPVSGGAKTSILDTEDLTNERLAKLRASPVTFQELLPGDDIRVYVIDGKVTK